jgi:hypothetical protein
MAGSPDMLTESQKAILPKDKHDDPAVAHISALPESSIAPLIPELLTWLQDGNWPVARPVKTLLLSFPHLIVEPVREVLLGDDDEWKDNMLLYIVDEIPREQQLALKQEVERIAKNPTKGEKDIDCDESARDILNKLESAD